MRRIIVLVASALLTLALSTGAVAMQPPAEPAQDLFGCPNPVAGHPGSAGIVDATHRVADLTGDPTPTAWNAVEHADPIELGEC